MHNLLTPLCKDDVSFHEIESSVYSFIPEANLGHSYDSKAKIYDAIIGNRLYNRLLWGNWPDNYRSFCQRATNSDTDGVILDVGCGSLVFTHEVYARITNRPIILLDRSIGMLLKGKERLLADLGKIPDNILFVHADALDLPFKSGAFNTVVSFGLLHVFEKPCSLLRELMRAKSAEGGLYATSLVANTWLGRRYLTALQKAGEVGNVHSTDELHKTISSCYPDLNISSIGNMAYIISS